MDRHSRVQVVAYNHGINFKISPGKFLKGIQQRGDNAGNNDILDILQSCTGRLEEVCHKDPKLIRRHFLFCPDSPVVQNPVLFGHTQDNIRIADINTKEHFYLSPVGSLHPSPLKQQEK
jgi:hypothetical protein